MRNKITAVLIIVFSCICFRQAFAFYAINCPAENINAQNGSISDVAYFDNMFNATDCNVTKQPDPTPEQINNKIKEQQAEANKPENKFNVDLFKGQLYQTPLAGDPNLFSFYAVLMDMISPAFKNFQGAANMIAGLLQAGAISQGEVNIIDQTLENQNINLAFYNEQVNVSY
jgi:hypothetical protein